MLVLKDPDNTVLKSVQPKKSPAANRNQRMGWTCNQLLRPEARLAGFNLLVMGLIENDRKEPSKVLLDIAHSTSQSSAINPLNERSSATLGTSKFAIAASEIA